MNYQKYEVKRIQTNPININHVSCLYLNRQIIRQSHANLQRKIITFKHGRSKRKAHMPNLHYPYREVLFFPVLRCDSHLSLQRIRSPCNDTTSKARKTKLQSISEHRGRPIPRMTTTTTTTGRTVVIAIGVYSDAFVGRRDWGPGRRCRG